MMGYNQTNLEKVAFPVINDMHSPPPKVNVIKNRMIKETLQINITM